MRIPTKRKAVLALIEREKAVSYGLGKDNGWIDGYASGKVDGKKEADAALRARASTARIEALKATAQAIDGVAHMIAEMRE